MPEEPAVTYRTIVPPDWVDYNGHLNVGYYMIAFDRATDGLAAVLGIGEDYLRRTGNSYYIVEAHLSFLGEVREGAPIRIASRLVAVDDKRLHFLHEMIEDGAGLVSATAEMLALHVDLGRRRAASFPQDRRQAIAALLESHNRLPAASRLGRAIALKPQSRG